MKKRILVTYATCTGCTGGVAQEIGKTLSDEDTAVDVKPMNEVTNLNDYSAVVAGSAIQASAWLPEAVEFIRVNQKTLSQKKVALFSVCMTLAMRNGEKYRSFVADFVKPLRDMVKPVSEAQFAGWLEIQKVPSPAERMKFRISVLMGVWKTGDHRNWDAIKSWAVSLKPLLA